MEIDVSLVRQKLKNLKADVEAGATADSIVAKINNWLAKEVTGCDVTVTGAVTVVRQVGDGVLQRLTREYAVEFDDDTPAEEQLALERHQILKAFREIMQEIEAG